MGREEGPRQSTASTQGGRQVAVRVSDPNRTWGLGLGAGSGASALLASELPARGCRLLRGPRVRGLTRGCRLCDIAVAAFVGETGALTP